ncbi:hypothetical protein N657DRAFT_492937 [Parathielavia appendiculata]|uniref:Uncharacterized protein n=1 Tax=Parathielavia appendiculata TaxID=2587402 RepID=A0AAN6Z301_9PEZI|nr:hypothetical protein N657DRAFT_492937 [Parathielavia appendiculata]
MAHFPPYGSRKDEHISKYVAIKVCVADAYLPEVDSLSCLQAAAHQTDSPKRSLIPILSDRFNVQGPNETHSCLVTASASASLQDSKQLSRTHLFPLDVA